MPDLTSLLDDKTLPYSLFLTLLALTHNDLGNVMMPLHDGVISTMRLVAE